MNEFDLIAAIRRQTSTLPDNGFEGIGDDCAILEWGDEALVFTTDALSEGVHFLRHTTTPEELGAKSLAVNLSDVAAMGIRPIAVLLTLSLPRTIDEPWVLAFMKGFTDLARTHNVALIGGDTTRSEGEIQISVTAIGRGPKRSLKRRSDARVGDVIFVSDALGGSAVGLRDLLAGNHHTLSAQQHRTPQPEVDAGEWLGSRPEVHAMMDLSDGLWSDVRHILKASHVGATVELENIPIAEQATLRDAVTGGEDYRLLLTADQQAAEVLSFDFMARFGRPLYPIGRIVEGERLCWLKKGKPTTIDWQGFAHFSH